MTMETHMTRKVEIDNNKRLWRIRFDRQDTEYWWQQNGEPGTCSGGWQTDTVRFTSFTTMQALACPWTTKPKKGPVGGGKNWTFEEAGTIIPLYEDEVVGKRKRKSK
jgi:hypothetical protein